MRGKKLGGRKRAPHHPSALWARPHVRAPTGARKPCGHTAVWPLALALFRDLVETVLFAHAREELLENCVVLPNWVLHEDLKCFSDLRVEHVAH